MSEELGKIEKPSAERFKNRRKLLLVPLVFSGKDAPPDYLDKFNRYWEQAKAHISNLEANVGRIRRVYHEVIATSGQEGLKAIEKLNPSSYQLAADKCQDGAQLEATEDEELLNESMDWERCILMGLASEKVVTMVSEFYTKALEKRYKHIARRIDETLEDDETAVLFIMEGHMVQFPQDIEVFSVAPPALDELHRWLRDYSSSHKEEEAPDERA